MASRFRIPATALAGFLAAWGTLATAASVLSAAPRVLASQAIPSLKPHLPTPAAPTFDPSIYAVKSILPINGPLKMGDAHWDERAAPGKGTIIITVDLAAQVLSVFRDGHEIGAAAILFGADAKPTPLGVYPVTQKDADHVSNIYHAPMPYMLRLTNDGISIHASEVEDGLMTHGCIGVPKPFAKKLFAAVKLGDKVIVTRGEKLDVGKPITAA